MEKQFVIKDVDVALVIAIRRTILVHLNHIAFDKIIFHKNTTPLHNEFMAHRLSLIPINATLNEIQSFDPEDFKFDINVENNTSLVMDITTEHITVNGSKNIKWFPKDPITGDFILITKLMPKGAFHTEMYVGFGTAKQHGKWMTVSNCAYFNAIDEELVAEKKKGLKGDELHMFMAIERERIFKKNKFDEPCEFVFTIESECGLTPDQIYHSAIQVLSENIKNTLAPNNYTLISPQHDNMFAFTVHNTDHTIGNLVQSIIFNHYVRPEKGPVAFVGYYQPHPLENDIVFKIKFKSSETDIHEFIKNVSKVAIGQVDDMLEFISGKKTITAPATKTVVAKDEEEPKKKTVVVKEPVADDEEEPKKKTVVAKKKTVVFKEPASDDEDKPKKKTVVAKKKTVVVKDPATDNEEEPKKKTVVAKKKTVVVKEPASDDEDKPKKKTVVVKDPATDNEEEPKKKTVVAKKKTVVVKDPATDDEDKPKKKTVVAKKKTVVVKDPATDNEEEPKKKTVVE
jgi:DNA-directed RNA polymerase subunit L